MEARRGRVFGTYLQDLFSLKKTLEKEKSGEDRFFRMNFPASHLKRYSIGGQANFQTILSFITL